MNFDELVKRDKGRNIKAELEQSMAEMRKLQQPKKNLKIPVEDNLDDIVRELEKRGYTKSDLSMDFEEKDKHKHIVTYPDGFYLYYCHKACGDGATLTTLAELKGM